MFRENSKFSVGFEENLEIVYQDDAKLSVTLHILSKKKNRKEKKKKKERNWGNTQNFRDDLLKPSSLQSTAQSALVRVPSSSVF